MTRLNLIGSLGELLHVRNFQDLTSIMMVRLGICLKATITYLYSYE